MDSPTREHSGCVAVGVVSVTTSPTAEVTLRKTIPFFTMITCGTGLRAVGRVEGAHGHPRQLSLVANLLGQVGERPAMQLPSLRAPNPYPVAYATKRFDGDAPTGALCPGYNLFGNAVVLLLTHASLPPLEPPQHTPGTLRPLPCNRFRCR